MENCVFCKIINKELPSYTVYEDENVIALLDINPKVKGHTLVIPKGHEANFSHLTADQARHLFLTTQKVLKALLSTESLAQGANILINQDQIAGQTEMHVHAHIIPRTHKNNFGLNFNHSSSLSLSHEQFQNIAKEISENLK